MTLASGHPCVFVTGPAADPFFEGMADDADLGLRDYLVEAFKLSTDFSEDANGSELYFIDSIEDAVGKTVSAVFGMYGGAGCDAKAYFELKGVVKEDTEEVDDTWTYFEVPPQNISVITQEQWNHTHATYE